MKLPAVTINLQQYRLPGSRIFSGRPMGLDVREKSHIDDYINSDDHVTVEVPADTLSVNASFLEELFYNVVRKLGKSRFKERFAVNNQSRFDLTEDLEMALDRIERNTSALTR